MGLLEVEFSPVVAKIMAKEPKEIEAFIRGLILVIDRQVSVIKRVQWSKDAEDASAQALEQLRQFMIGVASGNP